MPSIVCRSAGNSADRNLDRPKERRDDAPMEWFDDCEVDPTQPTVEGNRRDRDGLPTASRHKGKTRVEMPIVCGDEHLCLVGLDDAERSEARAGGQLDRPQARTTAAEPERGHDDVSGHYQHPHPSRGGGHHPSSSVARIDRRAEFDPERVGEVDPAEASPIARRNRAFANSGGARHTKPRVRRVASETNTPARHAPSEPRARSPSVSS